MPVHCESCSSRNSQIGNSVPSIFHFMAQSLCLTSISAVAALAQDADSTSSTMLAYDVSGSMWGKLEDGTTKVESARKVLRGYLNTVEPGTAIGVVAYGHRRKGDCADIELIAPRSQDTKGLADKIDALAPPDR